MIPERSSPIAGNLAAPADRSARGQEIASHELFRGAQEIIIVHHNEEYRLRITRQNKLILTK